MSGFQSSSIDEQQAGANQYLTFILAGEEYGVDILRVQEIRSWQEPTRIPNMPDFILGVINLRGNVVPIVDLRRRFALENVEFDATTVVIVVKISHKNGERTIGLVVDAVTDVNMISQDDIQTAPDFGKVVSTDFVKGLANIKDRMVILLEIDSLINVGLLQDVVGQ